MNSKHYTAMSGSFGWYIGIVQKLGKIFHSHDRQSGRAHQLSFLPCRTPLGDHKGNPGCISEKQKHTLQCTYRHYVRIAHSLFHSRLTSKDLRGASMAVFVSRLPCKSWPVSRRWDIGGEPIHADLHPSAPLEGAGPVCGLLGRRRCQIWMCFGGVECRHNSARPPSPIDPRSLSSSSSPPPYFAALIVADGSCFLRGRIPALSTFTVPSKRRGNSASSCRSKRGRSSQPSPSKLYKNLCASG